MKTESIRLYEDREDVTLTPCLISETGEMHAQGKRPAVLICPGGAYLSCSDREAEPVALQFMAMGYHAFVLRYSVFFGTQQGWPDLNAHFEVKQDRVHPAPVREIGMAMKLIHDRAEEWNVDTDRIAVCGFSAGGHNAAMYSVYWG
jgi:acetyl esterase/lipase